MKHNLKKLMCISKYTVKNNYITIIHKLGGYFSEENNMELSPVSFHPYSPLHTLKVTNIL